MTPDPMTPPETAEAVARLNEAAQWQMGGASVMVGVEASDLRALLAAYADAARDRERFRNYGDHTETCDSWGGVSTDPSGCSCGFNAAWYAAFPEDRVADAARTGEAR